MSENCPVCTGREPGLRESFCQKHFDEISVPSEEEIRAALERGKKARNEVRQANRARRRPICRHCGR